VTLATPPFGKIFGVMSGLFLGTRASNLKSVAVTVLELLAFNSHDRPLRTDRQTDRDTHIERTHYLRHSLRSLGGDKNDKNMKTIECRKYVICFFSKSHWSDSNDVDLLTD